MYHVFTSTEDCIRKSVTPAALYSSCRPGPKRTCSTCRHIAGRETKNKTTHDSLPALNTMETVIVEQLCRHCDDFFTQEVSGPGRRALYCSDECGEAARAIAQDRRQAAPPRAARFPKRACRECNRKFTPEHGHQAICSDKCRRARANRKTAAWEQQHREHCRQVDRAYEQANRDHINALRRGYRAADPEHHRRKSRENHARHRDTERVQYAEWQKRNREKRSLYMRDWDRRKTALLNAKQDMKGGFAFVRTLPIEGEACFWRAVPIGRPIPATEEIVAIYEPIDNTSPSAWRVSVPWLATPAAKKIAAVLIAAEEKTCKPN
jgi:hypothetical protein